MKDDKEQVERMNQALHEHDWQMIERCSHFFVHQRHFEQCCILRETNEKKRQSPVVRLPLTLIY